MRLSVIITSRDAPDLLSQCLAALVPQRAAAEIIVADCSRVDPSPWVGERFPGVRVLRFETMTVPALRWAAVRDASGEIVGAIESRSTPAADWCERIRDAHARADDAPAVGGPVALRAGAPAAEVGLYLCEYAAFAPPVDEGVVPQLSGANLSYKRRDLQNVRDLLDRGVWEGAIHERWRREGRSLVMSRAAVTFQNGWTVREALGMRFHYARSYAAQRVSGVLRRAGYAVATPLLPALLTWRVARAARRKNLAREFRRAGLWVLVFNVAWSAGELAGYLRGRPSRPRIY